MNLFATWFLITSTSAKSQMNDIIVFPDFSFIINLLLSNELPYNFHFLRKFSGVSELLAETSKYMVMCDL